MSNLSQKTSWYAFTFMALLLCQCRQPSEQEAPPPPLQLHYYQQPMMGTHFSISLYTEDSPQGKSQADEAAEAAFQLARDVNTSCSDYDVTSELMKLNDLPARQAIPLSPLLFDVLSSALKIARETNGAYDPTLGHHSYNWRMARKKGVLPSQEKITLAKTASGWSNLLLNAENHTVTKKIDHMRLDLGGIAKGYAAEKMLQILQQHQLPSASVTAGGEVRLGDPPPGEKGWKITLKTLDTSHQLSPKTITLSNCAISTSGDLHQSIQIAGQRYSHIVDPATGLGLTTRVSATIIGKDATLTDALATAYCVQPTLHFPDIQSMVIRENEQGVLVKYGSVKK